MLRADTRGDALERSPSAIAHSGMGVAPGGACSSSSRPAGNCLVAACLPNPTTGFLGEGLSSMPGKGADNARSAGAAGVCLKPASLPAWVRLSSLPIEAPSGAMVPLPSNVGSTLMAVGSVLEGLALCSPCTKASK